MASLCNYLSHPLPQTLLSHNSSSSTAPSHWGNELPPLCARLCWLRLCYIKNWKYGRVEVGNLGGPLGRCDGAKVIAYRLVLADEEIGGGGGCLRHVVEGLVGKSIRDDKPVLAGLGKVHSSLMDMTRS